jgi:hypothetical protein
MPVTLEDRDYVQRFRVGPVDNEVRINWELHRFVRKIFAPVTDAWAFGERSDLVANSGFDPISDLRATFFLNIAPDLDQIERGFGRKNVAPSHSG